MEVLAPNARAENEACEAVVHEMHAFFKQNNAPEVALKLLDEVAGRIALRRLLDPRMHERKDPPNEAH
jgi:hypothetical protein